MFDYVALHVHTDKSVMDGTATAEEYAARAVEIGMKSIAITDHGTLSGHRDWQKIMRKNGIKPILGIEAYITHDISDRRDPKKRTDPLDRLYNHVTILAKDYAGYQNLSRLTEMAWQEGYYHKPRIDFNMLDQFREGLIIGSACMGGMINSAIELGEFATAKKNLGILRDIGGEDFYIEVMPHNTVGINSALIELADEVGAKTIVTPDCHHAHTGQKVIQEIMLSANTHPKPVTPEEYAEQVAKLKAEGRTPDYRDMDPEDAKYMRKLDSIYGPDRRMTFNKFDIHLMSGEEMWAGMEESARADSFENTLEVDSKIEDFDLPEGLNVLPEFGDAIKIISDRCNDFLDAMSAPPEYYSRLEHELTVVSDKGFGEYFLVVNDIVSWARKQGIRVGPGRGSGVGSLINYCLGTTGIDPVEHKLIFERFIDYSREDWPDIDVDFQDTRRDEVKQYVAETYGNVAGIATYAKFQGKNMIKDIARVFQIPIGEVNAVTKLIDDWDEYKESSTTAEFRKKYPFIERYGDLLRGRTAGTGVHPSGMVVSKVPLADIAPIETRAPKGGDRVPVVAVDMDQTADIGLIKLDILGLKALSTIEDTLDLIESRHGIRIDLNEIDLNDKNVFAMLSSGHTQGVFQCEQAPYTKLLINMGADNFNDLAATNALVRPGAAGTIGKEYIMRKLGRKRVSYVHESMKPYLEESLGLPVYQEQIMRMCTEVAGMTMLEANKIRKITAKKKDASELEPYRIQFIEGATRNVSHDDAVILWSDILKWSGYGFNKAHAVAYSMISYQMAWLKFHYGIEFMVSTLNNEGDKDSVTQYLIESKRMGISVMLPNINKSENKFSIEDGKIRMGLSSIKFVSDKIAGRYLEKRPFNSYKEIEAFTFTKGNGVNSGALSAMRLVGALPFDDTPDIGDVKDNLYEYLNLPELSNTIPHFWTAYMTTADEYDESATMVMMGIVTNVRRGAGWSLITAMDSTGTFGVFDSEDSEVVKGSTYLFLIGQNRIVSAIPLENIDKGRYGIVEWLNSHEPLCAANELYVLNFSKRTTKAGKKMGTIIAATHDKELVSMVVFPTQFARAYATISPGNAYRFVCEEKEGLIFKNVE